MRIVRTARRPPSVPWSPFAIPQAGRRGMLGLILLGVALGASGAASAQTANPSVWITNGTVYALARSGNTIYAGGSFGAVAPLTGAGVPVSATSGLPVTPFPMVFGRVDVALGDGQGGWFVGGLFSSIGGLPRSNLAHILADGSVSTWAPQPDGQVCSLVMNQSALLVGGSFQHIAGIERHCLAALDTTSGSEIPWTTGADGTVWCLLVSGSV